MKDFLHRHASLVTGALNGFDRVLLRGTRRMLANVQGLGAYLHACGVKLKEFGPWAESITAVVREAGQRVMREAGREVRYIGKSSASKERMAMEIAQRDKIECGPVCLIESIDPYPGFQVYRCRQERMLKLVARTRQCVHQYHYWIDPQVGWMHTRTCTWLPLGVKVCLNGREWLCRRLTQLGIAHVRRDNCLSWVSDVEAAQRALDEQVKTTNWPRLLDGMLRRSNPPLLGELVKLEGEPLRYYWSMEQSEWASDVMFRDASSLSGLYPKLIHQGMTRLGSVDVLKFLGTKIKASGMIPPNLKSEVISSLKRRPEGLRIKHQVGSNSVKMYDKQGSVLRVETTINDAGKFKTWRGTEADPSKKAHRKLRQGVCDARRRAKISQGCNRRYFEALGSMECEQTVSELLMPLSRAAQHQGRRYRGLRLLSEEDGRLLETMGQGQWALGSIRNADLRQALCGVSDDKSEQRRQSARIGRGLALLRAHGLARRLRGTHRWMLTARGRRVVTLLSMTKSASSRSLLQKAA